MAQRTNTCPDQFLLHSFVQYTIFFSRLVCIDFPGHGLSSHLPKGLLGVIRWDYLLWFVGEAYNMQLESIGYIQRVRKHLGLEKFGIIGHSMGAGLGSLYTATFPEHVQVG